MADDLNKDLEEQQQRLSALRQEVEKLTKITLTKKQRQLQKLRREYAQQSKKVQELTKHIKGLRTEKTQLTKAAEQLTSKFGGTAGAVTRFTSGLKDSVFTTDKATGTMKVFGQQTAMTSTKFTGYAVAIQLAITATIAFLEWVDKAEIKQGKLQRALGSTGVSIGASMRAQAAGYKTAGEAGAVAAEDLTSRIAKARRGLFVEYGVGAGGEGFEKLLELTTGMSQQVPQWFTTLTETFAMGAGPEGGEQITETLERLGQIAHASNVDVDLFSNMVFDLATEFVHLGVDVAEATDAVTVFVDEMGKSVLTPAVGMAVMRNVFQQQKTAAGLQGRLLTAAFSAQVFDSLGEDVQDMLNITAVRMTGDKRATWQSLDVATQAEALGEMDKGSYIEVMRGMYEWLAAEREIVRTKVAPQMFGVEWRILKKFFEEELPGLAPEGAAEKLEEMRKTGPEKLAAAVEDFHAYVDLANENQKEFTAGLKGVVKDFEAVFAETVKKAKEEDEAIGMQIMKGTSAGLIAMGERQREESKSVIGGLEEEVMEKTITDWGKTKLQMHKGMLEAGPSLLERGAAWLLGKPTGPTGGGDASVEGTTEVDTPAGKVEVTAKFTGGSLIKEKPSTDTSGAPLRGRREVD